MLQQRLDGRVAADVGDDDEEPVAGGSRAGDQPRQQTDQTDGDHDRRRGQDRSQHAQRAVAVGEQQVDDRDQQRGLDHGQPHRERVVQARDRPDAPIQMEACFARAHRQADHDERTEIEPWRWVRRGARTVAALVYGHEDEPEDQHLDHEQRPVANRTPDQAGKSASHCGSHRIRISLRQRLIVHMWKTCGPAGGFDGYLHRR